MYSVLESAEIPLPFAMEPDTLAELVHAAPFAFAVFDAGGRYVYVNAALAALNRIPIDAHLGRTVEEVVPDVASTLRASIARAVAGESVTALSALGSGTLSHVLTFYPLRSRGEMLVGTICAPLRASEETTGWRLRYAFEDLLSTWATRLLAASSDTIDETIRDALAAISNEQGYPRAAIVRFDSPDLPIEIHHEWHVPGRVPIAAAARGITIRSIGAFGEALLAGETIALHRDRLPPTAGPLALVLAAFGIGQIVALPLVIDGEIRGCAAFEGDFTAQPSAEIERRLRLLSNVLATAIVRGTAERAQRAAFEEIARLKIELEQERDYLREELANEHGGTDIVGTSSAMRDVLSLVHAVARTPAAVLVRGESGVGKELVARAIHSASDRAEKPLVRVNCATIPRELFESEFFGHVRGAFTGAIKDRVGRFELANGGTIFLDEIGEIPLSEQAKLLRVLQEGEFERVGDDRTRRVDVRIVAATNRRLERDVAEGRFRRDLYFRLNVFPIEVPPLRERRDDVVPLAEHFLRLHAARHGRRGLLLSDRDRALLRMYAWPGNVRELANTIERAVILSASAPLRLSLPEAPLAPSSFPATVSFAAPVTATAPTTPPATDAGAPRTVGDLRQLEIEMIYDALEASEGRISGKGGAAERLGLSPSTLRDRIKALGIHRAT